MKIDGQPTKAYRLYRVNRYGEIVSVVVEADTLEELHALHKRRRRNWHYVIHHNRKSSL